MQTDLLRDLHENVDHRIFKLVMRVSRVAYIDGFGDGDLPAWANDWPTRKAEAEVAWVESETYNELKKLDPDYDPTPRDA